MPKKNQKKPVHTVQPSLAFALIAIAIPLLAAGILPSFAEETGTGAYQNPSVHQSGLMGNSLFNAENFLLNRRLRHSAPEIVPSPEQSSMSSSSSISPCGEPLSTSSQSSVSSQITVYDLSDTQRETLRLQLRSLACPVEADPAYLDLCQRLLKMRPALETKTGPANPNQ